MAEDPRRRSRPTPIFVISYNRPDSLRMVLNSYRRLDGETELIIHDNGSNDPRTRRYLDELSRSGTIVVHADPVHEADDLNRVDETIREYFGGLPGTRYVVTDCDVDLSIADPAALSVYSELLDRFPDAACVGPMLRICDIDAGYPLRGWVLNRHIKAFWSREPDWIETTAGRVAYLRALVDTTFALHRVGEPFRRLKQGIRVYFPFEARHLDWYPDAAGRGDDGYAGSSSAAISHWNNLTQLAAHRDEQPRYDHFFYVDRNADGTLQQSVFEVGAACRNVSDEAASPPSARGSRAPRDSPGSVSMVP